MGLAFITVQSLTGLGVAYLAYRTEALKRVQVSQHAEHMDVQRLHLAQEERAEAKVDELKALITNGHHTPRD